MKLRRCYNFNRQGHHSRECRQLRKEKQVTILEQPKPDREVEELSGDYWLDV